MRFYILLLSSILAQGLMANNEPQASIDQDTPSTKLSEQEDANNSTSEQVTASQLTSEAQVEYQLICPEVGAIARSEFDKPDYVTWHDYVFIEVNGSDIDFADHSWQVKALYAPVDIGGGSNLSEADKIKIKQEVDSAKASIYKKSEEKNNKTCFYQASKYSHIMFEVKSLD